MSPPTAAGIVGAAVTVGFALDAPEPDAPEPTAPARVVAVVFFPPATDCAVDCPLLLAALPVASAAPVAVPVASLAPGSTAGASPDDTGVPDWDWSEDVA